MSLVDRAHILAYTKWLTFLICTAGFVWKMSDSFSSYFSEEIGTKTDLKSNYETDLPGLAVCRHPNQIVIPDLEKKFKLKSEQLRYTQ